MSTISIALSSLFGVLAGGYISDRWVLVRAKRNDIGLTEGFDIENTYPCFGNDDDRVDLSLIHI